MNISPEVKEFSEIELLYKEHFNRKYRFLEKEFKDEIPENLTDTVTDLTPDQLLLLRNTELPLSVFETVLGQKTFTEKSEKKLFESLNRYLRNVYGTDFFDKEKILKKSIGAESFYINEDEYNDDFFIADWISNLRIVHALRNKFRPKNENTKIMLRDFCESLISIYVYYSRPVPGNLLIQLPHQKQTQVRELIQFIDLLRSRPDMIRQKIRGLASKTLADSPAINPNVNQKFAEKFAVNVAERIIIQNLPPLEDLKRPISLEQKKLHQLICQPAGPEKMLRSLLGLSEQPEYQPAA